MTSSSTGLLLLVSFALAGPLSAQPFSTNMDAGVILGQANATDQLAVPSQTVMTGPSGASMSITGKLAISDQEAGRVLIWNAFPINTGEPADVVLGKPDFTTVAAGVTASRTGNCDGVVFSPDGAKVIVSDSGNNRVLIWNTVPTANGTAANVVLGQSDFVTGTTGLSSTKFNRPVGLAVTAEGKLIVGDFYNNRVLIYNSIPTVSNTPADVVIGQTDMNSALTGNGASQMITPFGVSVTREGKLLVADYGNGRVLVYNSVPTTNGASADLVIGKPSFGIGVSGTASSTNLLGPAGCSVSPTGQLAISDYSGSRVLIYNAVPSTNGAAADVVLGQPDFTTGTQFTGGVSAHSMNGCYPPAFTFDGRLVIPGRDMNRAMIFGSPSGLVVPSAYEGVQGPTGNAYPFNLPAGGLTRMRYQQVYASSQFGSAPITITHLVFRQSSGEVPFSGTLPDIQIELMTTSKAPGTLSTTFAENRGADAVVARARGPLTLTSAGTGSPKPFDIIIPLTTPFVYTPAAGHLLMEVRNYGGGASGYFDAANTAEVQRILDDTNADPDTVTIGTAPTFGLITKFVFFNGTTPIPAPVASTFAPVITGNGAPNAAGTDSGMDFDALQRSGYLAQNGNLTFLGYLKMGVGGVDNSNFMGYWKHDGTSLRLLARQGDNAPETGATAAKFNILPLIPGISESGQVTLFASLLQSGLSTPATTASNDVGLWSELGGTGFQILMREDDTIPGLGGPKVDSLGFGCFATATTSGSTGEAAFVVGMKGSSTDTALLRTSVVSSDTTAVGIIARENTAAPGAGENFAGLNNTVSRAVRMDATGNVVFAAGLASGKIGIWYQDQATKTVSKSIFTGDAAPGTTGATFQQIDLPNMGGGGTFAFRAVLNTLGDNADNSKNDGIWKATGAAAPALILRRGDSNTNRAGLFGATYTGSYPNIKAGNIYNGWLTNANHGAWLGWVDLGGNGISAFAYDGNFTATTDSLGIYTDTSGTMTLLTASGQPAPGIAGANFFLMDHPVCGGAEQVAFIGVVTGGGVSSGVNDKGIWRTGSNGSSLALALRTGDTMSVSVNGTPTTKTIADLDIPGSGYAEHIWETPVMDGTGRLLVFVTFTDGTTSQVLVP